MRKTILFLVSLLLVSCGTPASDIGERAGTPSPQEGRRRLPRQLTYEDVRARAFRNIWIESSKLDIHRKRGPGITLAVEATFNNTSDSEVRPACWLEYGSQIRLFEVEDTPVVPANSRFSLEGLVRFPSRLDANESEIIHCRPMRDNEIAPEDE